MPEFTDKIVVVTGGSAGLGLAIATAFARAGARVILAARDQQRLAEAVSGGEQAGLQLESQATDVTDEQQCRELFERVIERHGRLDVLVNCAGRSSRGEAYRTDPSRFQELWELNFLAAARCAQLAAPHLIESRGHLINIGSLASKCAAPFLGAYAASKFPLAAYSQQLRFELGPQGVHVLLVCPGPIRRVDGGTRYDAEAEQLPESARQPGGGVRLRGLDPDEVARRILRACQRRQAELILPWKAKLLFVIGQISPAWGDWLVKRMMK